MVLQHPPAEVLDLIYKELEVNEQLITDSVRYLREWMNTQPHLPKVCEDSRLKTLILQCKGRIEIAKSVLDMYFTLRTRVPDVLSNRDPFAPWFKDLTERILVVPLPHYTDDFCRVIIYSAINPPPDIKTFDLSEIMKLIFMITDIRCAEDVAVADVVLIDAQKVTAAHAAKFTPPFFTKLKLCALRGYKSRVKAVHLLNASSFLDSVITVAKTIIKQKHRDRIVVHRDGYLKGYDSLHAHISPKILPKEYGGEAGSVLDMWDSWKKKVYSYREWFISEGAMTTDETKRPGKAIDTGEMFGFEGTFRQLNID